MAHVCDAPTLTSTNNSGVATATGFTLGVVEPSPSVPNAFASQQNPLLSTESAHVLPAPTASARIDGADSTRDGVPSGRVMSTPFVRDTQMAPQQNADPSAVMAHVRRAPAAIDVNR